MIVCGVVWILVAMLVGNWGQVRGEANVLDRPGQLVSSLVLASANMPPMSGRTLHVPTGYATIQAAVDAAQNGDLVLVAPGIYREFVVLNGKAITLEGAGGEFGAIIQAPPDKAAVTCVQGEGP